jgi:hydroxymethylglutaryl-CoA reductase (NADPH)
MNIAKIPMKTVGPIKIIGPHIDAEVRVPLATYEAPLWPSVNRGAKVSREAGGICAIIVDERMTRSVVFEALDAKTALRVFESIKSRKDEMDEVVGKTSHFAKLLDVHSQIVGNLLYLRFEFSTGDAAGHNMVTKAADHLMSWMLGQYAELKYISISGNFCADKKVSAVNGILGRGKYVVAEIMVPEKVCQKILKTTPEKIVELNIKKNLLGTTLAGGLRTANAHFANMLAAFYLAVGQDVANIIEGSQGFVHTEVKQNDLYFSVTLPNIIVGAVGAGKTLDFVRDNLKDLGCLQERESGENARRLAVITAATVLCGELSLLAALTNPGELMRGHTILERGKRDR